MARRMLPSNGAVLGHGRYQTRPRKKKKLHTQKGIVIAESLKKGFFSNISQNQQRMLNHPQSISNLATLGVITTSRVKKEAVPEPGESGNCSCKGEHFHRIHGLWWRNTAIAKTV